MRLYRDCIILAHPVFAVLLQQNLLVCFITPTLSKKIIILLLSTSIQTRSYIILYCGSWQKKCDSLEAQNSLYGDKFTQLDVDRRDILSYLQMLLMQKGL